MTLNSTFFYESRSSYLHSACFFFSCMKNSYRAKGKVANIMWLKDGNLKGNLKKCKRMAKMSRNLLLNWKSPSVLTIIEEWKVEKRRWDNRETLWGQQDPDSTFTPFIIYLTFFSFISILSIFPFIFPTSASIDWLHPYKRDEVCVCVCVCVYMDVLCVRLHMHVTAVKSESC